MPLNNVITSIVNANLPPEINLAYFTNILYVSPSGDNSDGSTWAKAFTTINAAVAVLPAVPLPPPPYPASFHQFYAIVIAEGVYDINVAGVLTIPCHCAIIGTNLIGHGLVEISNTNVAGTGIFDFDLVGIVMNLAFAYEEQIAIYFDCGYGGHSLVANCQFDNSIGGGLAAAAIKLSQIYVDIINCHFMSSSDNALQPSIYFERAGIHWIKDCIFSNQTIALYCEHDSDRINLQNCVFNNITQEIIGKDVLELNPDIFHFIDCSIVNSTGPISLSERLEVTKTNTKRNKVTYGVIPNTSIGAAANRITTGAADVFGAYTELANNGGVAPAILSSFELLGVMVNAMTALNTYYLEIKCTQVGGSIFTYNFVIDGATPGFYPIVEPHFLAANTKIEARAKDSVGAATMDVWLQYQIV